MSAQELGPVPVSSSRLIFGGSVESLIRKARQRSVEQDVFPNGQAYLKAAYGVCHMMEAFFFRVATSTLDEAGLFDRPHKELLKWLLKTIREDRKGGSERRPGQDRDAWSWKVAGSVYVLAVASLRALTTETDPRLQVGIDPGMAVGKPHSSGQFMSWVCGAFLRWRKSQAFMDSDLADEVMYWVFWLWTMPGERMVEAILGCPG